MQTIKTVISYMENGDQDCPDKLADAIDRLAEFNPKEFLMFWSSLKEFENPKQMRTNFVPQSGDDEKSVTLHVIRNETEY
jgi:hypothetical protein